LANVLDIARCQRIALLWVYVRHQDIVGIFAEVRQFTIGVGIRRVQRIASVKQRAAESTCSGILHRPPRCIGHNATSNVCEACAPPATRPHGQSLPSGFPRQIRHSRRRTIEGLQCRLSAVASVPKPGVEDKGHLRCQSEGEFSTIPSIPLCGRCRRALPPAAFPYVVDNLGIHGWSYAYDGVVLATFEGNRRCSLRGTSRAHAHWS
jgi:hypothetical protein